MRDTANAFNGLDFVWNHVGHPGPASVEGIEMADFDLAIDLNLRTVRAPDHPPIGAPGQ